MKKKKEVVNLFGKNLVIENVTIEDVFLSPNLSIDIKITARNVDKNKREYFTLRGATTKKNVIDILELRPIAKYIFESDYCNGEIQDPLLGSLVSDYKSGGTIEEIHDSMDYFNLALEFGIEEGIRKWEKLNEERKEKVSNSI